MYLKYGGYTHSANEAIISIRREPVRNASRQAHKILETWEIRGKLFGDTQAEITTAIETLKVAYGTDGGDLVLLHNDGSTVSGHTLISGQATGGTRVVAGPSFPEASGAEYATYRTYEITVEAEFPTLVTNILHFEESISWSGGSKLWAHLPLLNGPPQKQLLYEHTAFSAVQRGSAVGYLAYPTPPSPIWPGDMRVNGSPVLRSPKRQGDAWVEWPIEWTYEFEAVLPLVGTPNRWP